MRCWSDEEQCLFQFQATVTPWVSAKVEAGVSVSIFVFGLGIDLHGWIMRTRFPLSLDTNYTKQPVITT